MVTGLCSEQISGQGKIKDSRDKKVDKNAKHVVALKGKNHKAEIFSVQHMAD